MTTIVIPLQVTVTPTLVTVAIAGQTSTIAVPQAPPVVTPPNPPPVTGQPLVVVSEGVNHWSGNYDWQVAEADGAIGPDGQPAIRITSQGGTGGFQPWYAQGGKNVAGAVNFDTTGLSFLTFVLAPTMAGQVWASGFEGQGDVAIPGANVINLGNFGPVPVIGQYASYQVPLGSTGYNLPAGQHVLKFMCQDQDNVAGNVWWIKSIAFS